MLKVTKRHLTTLIKEELKEITEPPSDLSASASPKDTHMTYLSKRYGWEPGKQVDTSDFDAGSKKFKRAERWNAAQAGPAAPAAAPAAKAKVHQRPSWADTPGRMSGTAHGLQAAALPPEAKRLDVHADPVTKRALHLQRRANRAAGYSSSGHRTAARGGKKLATLTPEQAALAYNAAEVDEGLTISQSKLTELIKQELREIMDLPSDLDTPAGEAELRMDALSKGWEELITSRILDGETGIWSNTEVIDPIDGERRLLDEFLAILGNYVVSDEIDEGDAKDLVKSIANRISDNLFEASPHEWGIAPPKWEGKPFERLQERDKD